MLDSMTPIDFATREYRRRVNALLYIATNKANETAGRRGNYAVWNRAFHAEIDRQTRIHGIRRMSYQAEGNLH